MRVLLTILVLLTVFISQNVHAEKKGAVYLLRKMNMALKLLDAVDAAKYFLSEEYGCDVFKGKEKANCATSKLLLASINKEVDDLDEIVVDEHDLHFSKCNFRVYDAREAVVAPSKYSDYYYVDLDNCNVRMNNFFFDDKYRCDGYIVVKYFHGFFNKYTIFYEDFKCIEG